MKPGDLVRVVTECRPKGLVPDKIVKLIYERYDNTWYSEVQDLPVTTETQHTVDSSKTTVLRP
jgi:hypothetical protein